MDHPGLETEIRVVQGGEPVACGQLKSLLNVNGRGVQFWRHSNA